MYSISLPILFFLVRKVSFVLGFLVRLQFGMGKTECQPSFMLESYTVLGLLTL